jgi:hypothetical protein
MHFRLLDDVVSRFRGDRRPGRGVAGGAETRSPRGIGKKGCVRARERATNARASVRHVRRILAERGREIDLVLLLLNA